MDSFMLPAEEIRAHTSAAEPQAKEAELLDGQTAHAYITRKLDQMGESDVCAVFMADIDNIPDITAELGSLKEADIEDRVGDIISSMFYGSDIVSRIDRDEYLIFTFWEADRQKLAEKTELLCDRLRFKAGTDSEFEVTVCVGVYMAKGSGLNFENLFGHAAAALYEAKNNGSGSKDQGKRRHRTDLCAFYGTQRAGTVRNYRKIRCGYYGGKTDRGSGARAA